MRMRFEFRHIGGRRGRDGRSLGGPDGRRPARVPTEDFSSTLRTKDGAGIVIVVHVAVVKESAFKQDKRREDKRGG